MERESDVAVPPKIATVYVQQVIGATAMIHGCPRKVRQKHLFFHRCFCAGPTRDATGANHVDEPS
jgi:hypothetical protein